MSIYTDPCTLSFKTTNPQLAHMMIDLMKINGFEFLEGRTRKFFYFFGVTTYTIIFKYSPSKEFIERMIEYCVKNEMYEQANTLQKNLFTMP